MHSAEKDIPVSFFSSAQTLKVLASLGSNVGKEFEHNFSNWFSTNGDIKKDLWTRRHDFVISRAARAWPTRLPFPSSPEVVPQRVHLGNKVYTRYPVLHRFGRPQNVRMIGQ
jgi:hypothetical protein